MYILSLDKGNEKFQGIVNFTFRTANIPQENYAEFINQLLPLLFLFKKYFFLYVSPPPLALGQWLTFNCIKIITKQIKQHHFSLEDEVLNKIV